MNDVAGHGEDVMTPPHPRETLMLFGHGDAEQRLLESYRGARIPHAWLIGGPPGIGKATLAYRMARFVLAHPDPAANDVRSAHSLYVEPANMIGRRVAAQAHPDLLVLERTIGETGKLRKVIEVDEVRRCVSFFGSTAGEGGWRVMIVDSVDELNASGENALLKVLEEPPLRSLLFLISHAPGRVLATIRSRCRRLMLRPLAAEDVARAVTTAAGNDDPSKNDVKAAAVIAEGSVARALSLLDGTALKLRNRVVELLDQLPDVDAGALHMLGDALAGSPDQQRTFSILVDASNAWLSSRLANKQASAPQLARVAEVWEKVNRVASEAEIFNLDRRPVIFAMFGLLAEAARS